MDTDERFPPDTTWIVKWFDRLTTHDCEVQAPTAGLAATISRRTLVMDGIPERHLSLISTKRQT